MQLAGREPTDDILGYKPFVDGLRAISIVAVVAYHAGVPGVESGFIGVDVFFVISGYLIISQIVAGLYAGTFSFAGFWARRVLRILPPYLLVVGACVLIAPLVLVTPAELEEFGREAQYSALMVVNYYFLASKGYFDISSELKPLLHLWSLAVEEQFYLVAPLILFGLWWFGRRFGRFRSATWALAIVGVATVSFAFCVARTSGGNSAFFLMPYRAWEFVLGGVIPLLVPAVRRRIPAFFVDLLAVVGAALIVGAALRLGEVPYPSYYALLPVAGACLVILTGLARPENPVARVLATGPFVWVGLISYAWYLWHWPLISFARIHNFGESIADWRWGAVALSLALAAATHHFLEVPIKRWRSTKRVRLGWHVTATGVAAAVCISLVGSAYVHLLAPAVERQLAAKGLGVDSDWTVLKDPCAIKPQNQELARCFGGGEERPFGILVGNSHARMIYGTLNDKADQLGVELVGLVKVACIPYYPVASLEG
ncbi:MAG TPA: acyltransferase family protein, partial [Bauldia sp.]|nr:acyltransferase family protein [Bauldia sp.]